MKARRSRIRERDLCNGGEQSVDGGDEAAEEKCSCILGDDVRSEIAILEKKYGIDGRGHRKIGARLFSVCVIELSR